jgi:hypothetical protein
MRDEDLQSGRLHGKKEEAPEEQLFAIRNREMYDVKGKELEV